MVPEGTTLLALVLAVNETTTTPEGTEDRVLALLESGTFRLTGNFRGGLTGTRN